MHLDPNGSIWPVFWYCSLNFCNQEPHQRCGCPAGSSRYSAVGLGGNIFIFPKTTVPSKSQKIPSHTNIQDCQIAPIVFKIINWKIPNHKRDIYVELKTVHCAAVTCLLFTNGSTEEQGITYHWKPMTLKYTDAIFVLHFMAKTTFGFISIQGLLSQGAKHGICLSQVSWPFTLMSVQRLRIHQCENLFF